MDLFVLLQIAPIEKIRFEHPVQNWVKNTWPNVSQYDADNHSDGIVINYGLDQIEKNTVLCVLIEAFPDQQLGGITQILEQLIRTKNISLNLFINGNNLPIAKMLSFLKTPIHKNLTELEIQELIMKH